MRNTLIHAAKFEHMERNAVPPRTELAKNHRARRFQPDQQREQWQQRQDQRETQARNRNVRQSLNDELGSAFHADIYRDRSNWKCHASGSGESLECIATSLTSPASLPSRVAGRAIPAIS